MKKTLITLLAVFAFLSVGYTYAEEIQSGKDNKKAGWYFVRGKDHQPSGAQTEIDISKYNACYLGDTSQKFIYLTFDNGYENGNTPKILDVLKEKNVPAAFFLTKPYIVENPEIVKRMADEGHLPCNHSISHKSFPTLSDEQIASEINGLAQIYNEQTGKEMPKFFRPPMGEYSERVLDLTNQLGYKTVFWSFAYQDWLVDNQPPASEALTRFTAGLHNGEIALLHAVSSANTESLASMIDAAREQGYEFRSLYDLPD
ncbi:delta-lactam-biosynthetic de-N-acetylase [Clostridia bacterium]|nr:delta-lactam-biosynthetic de-N-acetylase [Clostridia bacterium]